MRISVIIATWNSEASIDQCLRSVLEQLLPVEVLLVDGGSSDRTLEIVRRHEGRLTRWVSEPDQGVYDALNKGVRLARGDYVYILGSDDCLADPEALLRLLDGGHGADVIYGEIVVKDLRGRLRRSQPLSLTRFRYQMPFSHQAVLVRRELLIAFPFGKSVASDYRHLYTLYIQGARFQQVPTPVAIYALGGLSDRHAVASTWDRWRINVALRRWRALDVLPFYLAQIGVCWLKPRLLRALRLRRLH